MLTSRWNWSSSSSGDSQSRDPDPSSLCETATCIMSTRPASINCRMVVAPPPSRTSLPCAAPRARSRTGAGSASTKWNVVSPRVKPGHQAAHGRRIAGPSVTGRLCAQGESARNAGGTPGCGTADGAARRTRGTRTGSPPIPAGRGCRRPACGAPAEREASAALAAPVRTRNAGTRVRTHRTGSLAPRPALCRAVAVRAAGCSMRSLLHGRAAACPVGTTR